MNNVAHTTAARPSKPKEKRSRHDTPRPALVLLAEDDEDDVNIGPVAEKLDELGAETPPASVERQKLARVQPYPHDWKRSVEQRMPIVGRITGGLPYARLVAVPHKLGTAWLVQASFLISGSDVEWKTVEREEPCDGQGSTGRKIYDHLVVTSEQARIEAEAVMRNVTKVLSVFVPLLREARALRRTRREGPPFAKLRAFRKDALARLESLPHWTFADSTTRLHDAKKVGGTSHGAYAIRPAGLYSAVMTVLFGEYNDPPVSSDGIIFGRFELEDQ